ncbi:helix-hairpin-helix protein [Labedella gwakjiensis]|uniref:Helix-hairpin-helix domain-containing protein n=1 Tax=Labedella gwakjiensis TaxID=390269 RepID=A0A2P8GRC0_9MICO|nr:helix-hairpin-helix domain-containing protein [Labedella gwakjiensis]PSL36518.1 helix-hairpin-helix protein [Labedella gwakjiensis]RUQ85564.1 helix-hairpin-helix domain-containing protein [Labedella gwakjiensis]
MTSASANGRWGGPDGPSFRWLVLTSLWLVFVLMPNGVTTWLGFAIIGFAVLRPLWIGAAVAYFVATVAIETTDALGVWSVVLGGVLWVVGIAHGISANRLWQTTLWSRMERGVRLLGRGTPRRRPAGVSAGRSSRSLPPEAVGLLDASGTDRSDYLADASPAPARPASSRPASSRRRTSSRGAREGALPATPVDVNTATQRDLQSLPGFTRQRAKAAIRERERLGGFSSVEQFGAVAGLQPHEVVRLGPALECSPKPRRPRSFGRRVDL